MPNSRPDTIARLIYMTTMAMKNCLEMRFRPHDLTTEQFHVLKNLYQRNGISQNRLGEMVQKSPANMTRILDRLEKKGCIVRDSNPDDRRSTLVGLTPVGEVLLERVRGELTVFEEELARGLSTEQLRQVKDGLKIIHGNILNLNQEEEG